VGLPDFNDFEGIKDFVAFKVRFRSIDIIVGGRMTDIAVALYKKYTTA
jgi:hypothetical protein